MNLRPDEIAWIDVNDKRCAACGHLDIFHNGHCCEFCTVDGCPCRWGEIGGADGWQDDNDDIGGVQDALPRLATSGPSMSDVCQKCGLPFGPTRSPICNVFAGRARQFWCADCTGAGQAALKAHAEAGYPSTGPLVEALALCKPGPFGKSEG